MSKQSELVGLARTTNLDEVNAAYSAGALSNRNLIINGEFLVWQRSENGYNGGGQAYLSADRFTSTRGRIRKPNTNGNTGEDNRGAVFDTTDGNIYAHFDYAVEDVGQKLNGKTMTFSFYAKILSGGTTLLLQDAGGDHLDFGNDRDITLTSNWERYTVTGTVVSTGSSFGIAMPRLYLNPYGGADPRMIQVDQFQLETGDTATPFEHRSYGDTLAQCQRFYENHTDPIHWATYTPAQYQANPIITYAVTKRAAPSVTISEVSGTLGVQLIGGGPSGFDFRNSNGSVTGTADKYFTWTADAEL